MGKRMITKCSKFPEVSLHIKKIVTPFLVVALIIGMIPLFPSDAFADQPELPITEILENSPLSESDNPASEEDSSPDSAPGLSPLAPDSSIEPLAAPSGGAYEILSTLNVSMSFDITWGSTNVGEKLQLWENNESAAQRFEIIANSDSSYTIRNINSGLVLDVPGANVYNGAPIWQYTANGTDAQKWIITLEGIGYKIASKINPAYCLDVPSAIAVNGARLNLYASNNTYAQRFYICQITPALADGTYIINSAANANMVLDIAGASSQDGTIAQFYTLNKTLAQRFMLAFDYKTGFYTITNVQSNTVIDVAGANKNSGARVNIYQANGTNAQKWTITALGGGRYRINAAHSGLVLGAPTGSINDQTPAQTLNWNNTANQQWTFTNSLVVDEGTYLIQSVLGTVMDAKWNGYSSGTPIWMYTANGSLAQRIYLKNVSGNTYKLDCQNSALLITAQGSSVVLAPDQNLDTQLWQIRPAGGGLYYLVNTGSGTTLEVAGGSAAPETNLQFAAAYYTSRQKWNFYSYPALPEGLYTIHSSMDPTKVLDITSNSVNNGARLNLYEENGTSAQVFRLEYAGYGNYRIIGANSNKSLDVDNGVLTPRGIIQQYTSWGGNTCWQQLWTIVYTGGGNYRIYCAVGYSQYCMTLEGNSTSNATPIYTYLASESPSQKFQFYSLGNSYSLTMGVSVDQMVQYQRIGNPYINTITDQQLRDVIDPGLTQQDYTYPGHSQYRYGSYQFVDLRGYTGMTGAQLDAIIQANAPASSNLFGKGSVFVQAAITYNINEVYLLAHCVLESGWGTSALAKDIPYDGSVIDGIAYPAGIYHNFFGIGAYDSSPYSGGASYAIRNGWDSVDKAILGGAKWIVENYIYRQVYYPTYQRNGFTYNNYNQPTLYAMKWDYEYSSRHGVYGWHQYATDHLWARKIARMMGDYYNSQRFTPNVTYIMPKYSG
jgi:beta-N-acetylglucosaminidase